MDAPKLTHLYRALLNAESAERWRQTKFTSFHPDGPPAQWAALWRSGVKVKSDYPLLIEGRGLYTERALDTFLRLAPEHDWSRPWPRDVAELDGVNAYDNPKGAWDYAALDKHPEHEPGTAFVEFDGEVVAYPPEAQDGNGAVQARVVGRSSGPLNPKTFKERYALLDKT